MKKTKIVKARKTARHHVKRETRRSKGRTGLRDF